MSADDYEWCFASALPARQQTPVTFTYHELVSDERRKEIDDATGLLLEVTESSQYALLYKRHGEFKAAIQVITESVGHSGFDPHTMSEISEQLDVLLSALRAFDDRTMHTLSSRYGEKSEPSEIFKAALRAEFDGDFAYRFCYKLRNYSQHCGSPIAGIRAQAARLPDGQQTRHCLPYFDSKRLLANYPDGWGPVKRDLIQMDGEFFVEQVIDSLINSCSIAFSELILAQEPGLMKAVEVLNIAANDATIDGGVPLLARIRLNDPHAMNPDLVPIRIEAAANAVNNLQQAKLVLETAGGASK